MRRGWWFTGGWLLGIVISAFLPEGLGVATIAAMVLVAVALNGQRIGWAFYRHYLDRPPPLLDRLEATLVAAEQRSYERQQAMQPAVILVGRGPMPGEICVCGCSAIGHWATPPHRCFRCGCERLQIVPAGRHHLYERGGDPIA